MSCWVFSELQVELVYSILVVSEAEVTVVGTLIGYVEVKVVSKPINNAWLLFFHDVLVFLAICYVFSVEPRAGFEPATYGLRNRRSNRWAIGARLFLLLGLDLRFSFINCLSPLFPSGWSLYSYYLGTLKQGLNGWKICPAFTLNAKRVAWNLNQESWWKKEGWKLSSL